MSRGKGISVLQNVRKVSSFYMDEMKCFYVIMGCARLLKNTLKVVDNVIILRFL